MARRAIDVDGNSLDLGQIIDVARHGAEVRIASHATDAINRSRAHVEDLVKREEVAYGITTGYGPPGQSPDPSQEGRAVAVQPDSESVRRRR